MIDWSAARQHLNYAGLAEKAIIALFPPKAGKGGCVHLVNWTEEEVEKELDTRPGYSLGYVTNPGGVKSSEITQCLALFYEDDNKESSWEEKAKQWEVAGLLRPSYQIWTGGKSVHNYWMLEEPCGVLAFKAAQKRLFRFLEKQEELKGIEIDHSLSKPCQILRLAGGTHPGTKNVSRIILESQGEKYSLEQLWAMTGDGDPLPDFENGGQQNVQVQVPQLPPPITTTKQFERLPERDDPRFKQFLEIQLYNDKQNNPQVNALRDFPRKAQMELAALALQWCPQRDEAGTNTYEVAFNLLASLVNYFGAHDALFICKSASWSQEHWDIEEQALKIEDNSNDRDSGSRRYIGYVFDTAEYNGWSRPWKLTRSVWKSEQDAEALAEARVENRAEIEKYKKARNFRFRLGDALPKEIAEVLTKRAKAFPVADVAMLPPFVAMCAAVIGTRFRVRAKKGFEQPMVFWMGSVGPASSLKSPVSNQILHPIKERDHRAQVEYKTAMDAWKREDNDQRGAKPEPPRRIQMADCTLEALGRHLNQDVNPGVVHFHDELMSFISSLDKYRKSGGGADRAQWLSMFDGGSMNIMRATSDPIYVPETAVSLFGNVQPEKLESQLAEQAEAGKSGDGFWVRFLWNVPSNPRPLMNDDETEINLELRDLVEALDSFPRNQTQVASFSKAAFEVFAQQCDEWQFEAEKSSGLKEAFLVKMKGYLVRFAGLLHCLDYADRIKSSEVGGTMGNISLEIEAATVKRAIILCEYFVNQFDLLLPKVGGGVMPSWAVKIMEFCMKRKDRTITTTDMRQRKWGKSKDERRQMLERMDREFGAGKCTAGKRVDSISFVLD